MLNIETIRLPKINAPAEKFILPEPYMNNRGQVIPMGTILTLKQTQNFGFVLLLTSDIPENSDLKPFIDKY